MRTSLPDHACLALIALARYGLALRSPRASHAASFLCAPELKVEPTWTVENLIGAPRIEIDGEVERESRATIFEMIFAVDVPDVDPAHRHDVRSRVLAVPRRQRR